MRYSLLLLRVLPAPGSAKAQQRQLPLDELVRPGTENSLRLGASRIREAIAVTVARCFIPFHKTLKAAIVKSGEDMV